MIMKWLSALLSIYIVMIPLDAQAPVSKKINPQMDAKRVLARKIRLIESLNSQRDIATSILAEASRCLPEGSRLTELEYSDYTILVKGMTRDKTAAAQYAKSLAESQVFKDAHLVSPTISGGDNLSFDFQISASFEEKEAAGVEKSNVNTEAPAETALREADIGAMTARLKVLEVNIPQRKETADILRQIQALAYDSRLDVLRFAPGTEINKGFYSEWPIPIQVSGSYHNLGLFFDRLSKFARVFTVQNFAIKALASQTDLNSISASYTLMTYFFSDGAITTQPQLTQKRSEGSSVQSEKARANKPRTPYSYSHLGRKDPFIDSQIRPTIPESSTGNPAQVLIEDVILIGITKSDSGFAAVVTTEKGFSRVLNVGDKLNNGYVLSISEDQIVFRQTHVGNLPLVRPRDIIKAQKSQARPKR